MDTRNSDIRNFAKRSGVQLWKIAEKLGIAENTFYRYLRYELTKEQRTQYIEIIKEIAEEQQARYEDMIDNPLQEG